MADIFVSYTSSDREWAFWIGHELEALGHRVHIHEWEISGGGDIMAWMEDRHKSADHVLSVVSKAYLEDKPYSNLERRAAQWAATTSRPNFLLPVFVEACEAPTLFAPLKRCDLYGLSEEDARARLKAFIEPARRPTEQTSFPGEAKAIAHPTIVNPTSFPGTSTLSNIPIAVPRHFVGRNQSLADIVSALRHKDGRAAITALHGLRGVGKTTLAAAYAERHRNDYLATWWIRAQEESSMRADIVALGVRLGWVAPEEKQEAALSAIKERLRLEGQGLLLIYDNAINADSIEPYLPLRGKAHILITSNSPSWGRIAVPVQIRVWPKKVGADYLIARLGRRKQRAAAEALSEALGGLPLAHEQAGAFCERLGISIADYHKRFTASPGPLLDEARDAPTDYHDRMTVAKTFALAIEQASKLHSAAEPLIVHAALLAPEPIPLFLFSEAREKLGEPLATALAGNGFDEAVAALRAFALVDRETIVDERDPAIMTDTIRLHRLVREVAVTRRDGNAQENIRRALIEAVAAVYPEDIWRDPATWPRARRLDAFALTLTGGDLPLPEEIDKRVADLLIYAGAFRHYALANYSEARPLFERALAIRERVFGNEHPQTATSLAYLALLLQAQGDFAGARPLYERDLAISEKALGPEHLDTSTSVNNLAYLLQAQGDFKGARPLYERALAIREEVLGPKHPDTVVVRSNLATLAK